MCAPACPALKVWKSSSIIFGRNKRRAARDFEYASEKFTLCTERKAERAVDMYVKYRRVMRISWIQRRAGRHGGPSGLGG